MSLISEDYVMISDPGDPSVGIQPATFVITGPFYFENTADQKEFGHALCEAFSMVIDEPHFEFQSQIDAQEQTLKEI